MKPQDHNEYRLRLQAEAAKALIGDMRDQHGADIFDGDQTFLVDAIEGETGLIEAIKAALEKREELQMMAAGISGRVVELEIRKARLNQTADRIKALIERSLVAAEIKTLPLPTATLTVANRAPALVVVEEADIPSTYFSVPETPAPKLDKKALTNALRARKAELDKIAEITDPEERKAFLAAVDTSHPAIAGAELDNGGVSLAIRSK